MIACLNFLSLLLLRSPMILAMLPPATATIPSLQGSDISLGHCHQEVCGTLLLEIFLSLWYYFSEILYFGLHILTSLLIVKNLSVVN